jgi:hypothetical protein
MSDTQQRKSTWNCATGRSRFIRINLNMINESRPWEESWEDGAQRWQAEPEMAYDPSKVHRVEFNGKYQKFSGYGQLHPSPQRIPVLFQAGPSPAGIRFSAKNAEALFTSHPTIERLHAFLDSYALRLLLMDGIRNLSRFSLRPCRLWEELKKKQKREIREGSGADELGRVVWHALEASRVLIRRSTLWTRSFTSRARDTARDSQLSGHF